MDRVPTEPLVGREDETQRALAIMRAAGAGRAATVLIEGEAGVGKTSFVRVLTDAAQADGIQVASGAAHPFETTRPFGCLIDALDLRRSSSDLRRAAIGELLAGTVEPVESPRPGSTDLRFRVIEEIVDLVEAQCSQAPLVLALDDVHWADTSTLLAIRTMASELVHVPMLLLATLRPSPRSAELKLLLDDLLDGGAELVSLEPLPPAAIDELVRVELGLTAGPALAALVAKAAGNPLWVVEILRSLSSEGQLERGADSADATASELPDSLRDLVLRRLRDLPQATLDLLEVTSVLGDAVAINDLAAVTRRSTPDLVATLRAAFEARLLGEKGDAVVFRHQLVHDAIYQSIPGYARTALHRGAASALADAGADLTLVASQIVLGASPGDLEAIRWLRDAARETMSRAPSEAIELLRCAERLMPGGHPDADLLAADLIEATLLAGQVADATVLADAVLDRPHRADVDVPIRLWLLETLSLQNRGLELIERAEATLAGTADLTLAQQSLVLAQASYGHSFSGDFVGGEAAARRALACAERAHDVPMTVWSLNTLSLPVKAQGRYEEALELTRRALELTFEPQNDAARLRHPWFFQAMALSDADRFDEARVAFRRAIDECSALGSSWILPDALLLAAELRFILGEWDDAWSELESGLQVAHERGAIISEPQTRAYQAIMSTARGDNFAAKAMLAPVEGLLADESPAYGVEMVAFAAALLAEAEGQAAKAYDLLASAWHLDESREIRYYHRYLAPLLVRMSLVVGDNDMAKAVAEGVAVSAELAPDGPTVLSAAARCRGLLEDDPAQMMSAVELARRTGRVLDRAFACEDAGAVLASTGRTDDAIALWSEAMELHEGIGATAWAGRAQARLRRLGVRRGIRGTRQRPDTGWDSLTPTELVVSERVAEGLTNREIARRLHVSPHTVNTHLRHIFQKLSVANRAALATEVANHSSE